MKYSRRPIIIEAFRAGIDDIPDWFMDRVSTNEVILKNEGKLFCIIPKWNDQITSIFQSDYIVKSTFPFVTYPPESFEAMYLKGDLTKVYTLGLELGNALEEADMKFTNVIQTHNTLHEDLRDLRRAITVNEENDTLRYLLLQLAVTAIQGRKDL